MKKSNASNVTTLAECTVSAFGMISIELVEADETPAVIIVRWPTKPTVLHPAASLRPQPRLPGRSPPPAPDWPASKPGGRCEQQRWAWCDHLAGQVGDEVASQVGASGAVPAQEPRTVRSIRPATVFVCNLGPLGNPSIVTVFWPSLPHGRAASTVQESRERDRLAVRDGQQPIKSDQGAGLKNDWVTALLVALQLIMLVLLVTGQIR
jgi:hypothetical protein